jgi:hypothetical protein
MVQRSPWTSTQISTCLNDLCMRISRTLLTEGLYLYHIQCLQHLETVDMGVCNPTIELMQTPKWSVHFCLQMRSVLPTIVTNTRNCHVRDHNNPSRRTIKSNYQYRFSINVVMMSLMTSSLDHTFPMSDRLPTLVNCTARPLTECSALHQN